MNMIAGGWAVSEILSWFNINIPLLFDGIIGFFTGQITIPVAIIGCILKLLGIAVI